MVYAIVFYIIWPVIEFFMYWGMRLGFRFLDRGVISFDDTITKKTTIYSYVELYSGPVFSIHYKYSFMLNITFVTFTYGVGLPLLFPSAAAAFLVFYVVEKSMLYYSYRQPPTYDDKLNNSVLAKLTWAPFIFLAFGYWMLSSR